MKEFDENLKGKKFNMLTLTGNIQTRISVSGRTITEWECVCECGNRKYINRHSILYCNQMACGCLNLKPTHYSHGHTGTRLYQAYLNMKARCYYKKGREYHNYGERGITVCDEWLGKNGASNFIEWSYRNGYSDNLTLDRIDVNKGYSPDNCRWITNKEQQSNRRDNHFITYKGRTQTITQWAEEIGISGKAFEKRIRVWKDVEKAIETPVQKTFFKDLRGYRFGRLTVIDFAEPQHRRANDRAKYFYCICDCGNECVTKGYSLTSGGCKSCGCLTKDKQKEYWNEYRRSKTECN